MERKIKTISIKDPGKTPFALRRSNQGSSFKKKEMTMLIGRKYVALIAEREKVEGDISSIDMKERKKINKLICALVNI